MKFYYVSFKYSEMTYCSNIATADCIEDVQAHYSNREDVSIREAQEYEVETAKRKGMPIVTCEHIEETREEEKEIKNMNNEGKKFYFYGNEVSKYGVENGFVDYATLAKSFDAVLNNDIINQLYEAGFCFDPYCGSEEYFEDSNGNRYYYSEASDRIEELEAIIAELEEKQEEATERGEDAAEIEKQISEAQTDIDYLSDYHHEEIFQYYIVSDNALSILEEAGEIVYRCEALDLNIWGVTHYGTSWSYVLTNIKLK